MGGFMYNSHTKFYDIAIMLARIKLTYPEIRDAIWNIDDHRLSVDNLMAIRQYIPNKEEVQ